MPTKIAKKKSLTLTNAEMSVLLNVLEAYAPGEVFRADDLYPDRNNQHNARRRTLGQLLEKGYIVKPKSVPEWAVGVFELPHSANPLPYVDLPGKYDDWLALGLKHSCPSCTYSGSTFQNFDNTNWYVCNHCGHQWVIK